jgi:hypothetical protein
MSQQPGNPKDRSVYGSFVKDFGGVGKGLVSHNDLALGLPYDGVEVHFDRLIRESSVSGVREND